LIERYDIRQISQIFAPKEKIKNFLLIEKALLTIYTSKGTKPQECNLTIDAQLLKEIAQEEQLTKHDVFAFINVISRKLSPINEQYFHFGLTSSDLVDTNNILMIKSAWSIINQDIEKLLKILLKLAIKYQNLNTLSRTHGQAAQITKFGLRFLLSFQNLKTIHLNLQAAAKSLLKAKLSGASGNYLDLSYAEAKKISQILDLDLHDLTTQVIPRHLFTNFFFQVLAFINEISRFAQDLRLLSMSGIEEVSEAFSEGQKGSSAMPQKRNPINLEQIMGLSRLASSSINVLLENNLLWLERDLTHSSNERIIFQDNLTLLCYVVRKFQDILKNLKINEANIVRNIELTYGAAWSSTIMNYLIKEHHYSRHSAYELLKEYSLQARELKIDIFVLLEKNDIIKRGETENLRKLNDLESRIKLIYSQVIKA
jgi:adenylosuccinate lyase